METLKDIFVSYEIAQKLKEIGFDEPCISYYEKDNPNVRLNEKTQGTIKHNGLLIYVSAPTWEQVKKWFRDKGVVGYLFYFENSDTWVFHIKDDNGLKETSDLKYETYEQAQEQLILKLIGIYKNEQDI